MPFVHRCRIAALVLALSASWTLALAAPAWQPRVWDDQPVRLSLPDHAALVELLGVVPLSRFDRETLTPVWIGDKIDHLEFQPRVTPAELRALRDAGYAPRLLPDTFRENRTAAETNWARRAQQKSTQVFTFPLSTYPTHPEIGIILADLAAAHPTIARTFQWGTSVQNRELWGIVISGDVNNTQAEPEVRLSSTMHGDEVVGMVMLLDFAEYLTTHYGQPGYADVTNLVDNYEIHIMPLHNPDGYGAGQRYNNNFVDLNRDFPLPSGTHSSQQVETTSFMNHANTHHFVVSENGHGGALVANYPWDYQYALTPDNDAIIELSLAYSTANLPMFNGSFPQGITNGAAWYVVNGSIQDWSYDQTGCIDVTIEHSNTKWPAATSLVGFWNDNRQSLMQYATAARYGINGVVTSADTGLPLDATITVVGNNKSVRTDPAHGDYYKLLATGTYDLTYSAPGYVTRTITGINTTWGTPQVQNVALATAGLGTVSGTARGVGGPNLTATVSFYAWPQDTLVTAVTSTAPGGVFAATNLYYGDYRLAVSAPGFAPSSQLISLSSAQLTLPTVYLAPATAITLFNSDFEGPLNGGWTLTSPWGTQPGGATGTATAMSDSPAGPYANNLSSACTMTTGVDLTSLSSGTLTYQVKWDIETNWDGCRLQVSLGGGAWTTVATPHTQPGSGMGQQLTGQSYYEGTQTAWLAETIDLAPWLGQTDARFRFVLTTDTSVIADGLLFDEFVIAGQGLVTSGAASVPVAPVQLTGVQPNPFNPRTSVRFTLAEDESVRLKIYDLTGHLVRTLIAGTMVAGDHAVTWDGRTQTGLQAASGVYLIRLQAAGLTISAKAMLLK